jgi:hypothetical protein
MIQPNSNAQQIRELAAQLIAQSAALRGSEDLEALLPIVQQLKSEVDSTVQRLRDVFDSPEWTRWLRQRKGGSVASSENPAVAPIYTAASNMGARLESTYKDSQKLSMQLKSLEDALTDFIPIYLLGAGIFDYHSDSGSDIRSACEDIAGLLEASFGSAAT